MSSTNGLWVPYQAWEQDRTLNKATLSTYYSQTLHKQINLEPQMWYFQPASVGPRPQTQIASLEQSLQGPWTREAAVVREETGGGLAVTCDCVFLTAGGMAETAVQEAC